MIRFLALAALLTLTGCTAARVVSAPVTATVQGVSSVVGAVANRGALCSDRRLEGEMIGRVPGEVSGCGIDNAARITAVDGIPLSQPAVMDCQTARAFADWSVKGAQRAVGRQGGGIAEFGVAAHYVCRTRNHRPGARISEHGKGKAIDISHITLADGDRISLIDHWDGPRAKSRALRRMHGAACGPFGTVLGPGSDGYHEDHFHFDTASHRGGPYCR